MFDIADLLFYEDGEKKKNYLHQGTKGNCTTENNEFYSPRKCVEAAWEVMGEIDLDPASCALANKMVKAKLFYDKEIDGLRQPWQGRVWMNPPYSAQLVGKFTERLSYFIAKGDVTEAVVLINNTTETGWFQNLASQASMICFPRGRIVHWGPGAGNNGPLRGSVLLYFGKNEKAFQDRFRKFGLVMRVTKEDVEAPHFF
jgi:ParB family transcriptional regulator, chromosome partitioning protein